MNAQTVFSSIVAHLIRQGVRSYDNNPDVPKYHAGNGDRSAIGYIIPPHQYHPKIEGKSIIGLIESGYYYATFNHKVISTLEENLCLLEELESIHNYVMPEFKIDTLEYDEEMKNVVMQLYEVANTYELTMPWAVVDPKYSVLHPKKVH